MERKWICPPSPCPLPQARVLHLHVLGSFKRIHQFCRERIQKRWERFTFSLGEKAGLRAGKSWSGKTL